MSELEEDHHSLRGWYDALSRSYDELYGQEQDTKHDGILSRLEDRHFESLVDVGCGTGRFLERVSMRFTRSVGIDVSGEMLRIAKSRIFKNEVEFVRAASPWLPLRDDVADCVVSVSLVESGKSPDTHFDEFARIKTHLGVLAVTVFGSEVVLLEPKSGPLVKHSKCSRHESLYVITSEGLD